MLKLISIFCILFISILVFLTGKTYLNLTELDNYNIVKNRAYYPTLTGRLFQNKLTFSFTKARKELFSYLSTDQLFKPFDNEN